ncbi:MAG TPA: outer membrane lipoprotein carrier protein LolA [Candidatus Sulfotelmatobacter sp.]|jgi:outer membrane lipoprotein-sorting protein|nr:outer membrane lipoprotein carrier protein LolA [Candidatus Sulfotelmatobacter sp.]
MSALTRLAGIATVLVALAGPAAAGPAEDKADTARAEEYLNTIKTLKARFTQISPAGDSIDGSVYLSRPGKMRLDYDPPSPIQVMANGNFLIYYDKQLKQVSYLDLESSIAGVLVRDQVRLDGPDLKLLKITHAPDLLNITVTHRKDPSQGQITLVFTEHPFALRQWKVVDAQNQLTTVSLYQPQQGIPLDSELFHFVDPNAANGIDLDTKGK